ncbi:MAG: UDP-N-acetylmuramate dehydrogenase [Clostridia bacterium]|nr:UDP-N-acetylmuramate dehydrogenase [Clostridia bacterium]
MSLQLDSMIEIRENEPLSKHSSFKIGGPAKYAIFPKNSAELISAVKAAKSSGEKYRVVGNGSNLLFDDNGFNGVIIFTKNMTDTEYIHKGNSQAIKVGCGRSLTELSSDAGKKHSLTGLEFAYGIPGTVGGAVYMNAGAYGGQMSDIVVETEYYDPSSDRIGAMRGDEHKFDYRHSVFAEHPEYIILSTTLEMKEGNVEDILAGMNQNMRARKEKQPLEYPSAGSTFKRPGGGLFAGKLIEDAGLKGYTVGGAQISQKHAGFTVNLGGATCADVLAVIEHTQKTVFEKDGVMLESEIIYIPE